MRGQQMVEQLIVEVNKIQDFIENKIESLPMEKLVQRPSKRRWSALECIEHMNLSSGHYIKRLERIIPVLEDSAAVVEDYEFVPGFFGEKFATGILPREDGSLSITMKTFYFFEPKLAKTKKHKSIEEFKAMNRTTLDLLHRSKKTDLNKGKITSTLGPIFRFKSGDAFRFAIHHNIRHILQIEGVIKQIGG